MHEITVMLLCPTQSRELEKVFLDLLTKPTDENIIFILSLDTTSQFHREQLEIVKLGYIRMGVLENNITIYNLISDTIPSFDGLDVLHMWGGNTFHYLKRIREIGLIPRIRDFIERDGVYVGTSAGSLIMSPDIDENLTIDANDIPLVDVTGFGYIDFYLLVHWDSFFEDLHTDAIKYG